MKAAPFVAGVTGVSTLIGLTAYAQQKSDAEPLPQTDSSITIITKVPFEGVNYFIKIVPIDTGLDERMPMYNPQGGRSYFWRDSLQRLLPDSLLKYLPRRRSPGERR